MPGFSFGDIWIDPLLRGGKQHTTRPKTDRFRVGDTGYIYIRQRQPIITKPMRTPTLAGEEFIYRMIEDERRYPRPELHPRGGYSIDPYYAHFLGTVEIAEVYDIHPCEMSGEELEAWAWADGFDDFDTVVVNPEFLDTRSSYAKWWFSNRYGNDWMQRWWTVVGWHGWLERYFEPAED